MSPLAPVDHHLTPIGVEVSWPLELSIGFRQGFWCGFTMQRPVSWSSLSQSCQECRLISSSNRPSRRNGPGVASVCWHESLAVPGRSSSRGRGTTLLKEI